MAEKKPIQANPLIGDSISLGEFSADDYIGVEDGGTGAVTSEDARTNLEVLSEAEVIALLNVPIEW